MPGAHHHDGRVLALQILCQWDVQGDSSDTGLLESLAHFGAEDGGRAYAMQITQDFWGRRDRLDKLIRSAATHWDLERISPVERNVMRVAVVELVTQLVPPRVALSEAVEIAREFGGAESPRFVNGVLDSVFKQLDKEASAWGCSIG
jgi:N utilization substance protein B